MNAWIRVPDGCPQLDTSGWALVRKTPSAETGCSVQATLFRLLHAPVGAGSLHGVKVDATSRMKRYEHARFQNKSWDSRELSHVAISKNYVRFTYLKVSFSKRFQSSDAGARYM